MFKPHKVISFSSKNEPRIGDLIIAKIEVITKHFDTYPIGSLQINNNSELTKEKWQVKYLYVLEDKSVKIKTGDWFFDPKIVIITKKIDDNCNTNGCIKIIATNDPKISLLFLPLELIRRFKKFHEKKLTTNMEILVEYDEVHNIPSTLAINIIKVLFPKENWNEKEINQMLTLFENDYYAEFQDGDANLSSRTKFIDNFKAKFFIE